MHASKLNSVKSLNFHRVAQKLNVIVRRGRHFSESSASQRMTNFSSLLQKSPPLAPANIIQAASKSKETPGMGKVWLKCLLQMLIDECLLLKKCMDAYIIT